MQKLVNILDLNPEQRRRRNKRIDKYLEISEISFAVLRSNLNKIDFNMGDEIEIEYTSRYGNKKKQRLKIIEQSWPPISAGREAYKYTFLKGVAI